MEVAVITICLLVGITCAMLASSKRRSANRVVRDRNRCSPVIGLVLILIFCLRPGTFGAFAVMARARRISRIERDDRRTPHATWNPQTLDAVISARPAARAWRADSDRVRREEIRAASRGSDRGTRKELSMLSRSNLATAPRSSCLARDRDLTVALGQADVIAAHTYSSARTLWELRRSLETLGYERTRPARGVTRRRRRRERALQRGVAP